MAIALTIQSSGCLIPTIIYSGVSHFPHNVLGQPSCQLRIDNLVVKRIYTSLPIQNANNQTDSCSPSYKLPYLRVRLFLVSCNMLRYPIQSSQKLNHFKSEKIELPHSTEIHITDARLIDLHLRPIEVVCVRCDTSTIQRSYASISYMVSGTFCFCYMQTCTTRMRFCYNKDVKELICVRQSAV